jgi:putative methionine-R-sulfoxide reductase with GAF domain
MDVLGIEPGMDFVEAIESTVSSCEVLLVVISQRWLGVLDPRSGLPKLSNLSDFVRLEVSIALKRNLLVIPVLFDGAQMPQLEELPDDLKALARKQAHSVRHQSFDADVAQLIDVLVRRVGGKAKESAGHNYENDIYYKRLAHAADLVSLLEVTIDIVSTLSNTDYNQIFLVATESHSKQLITVAHSIAHYKQGYRIATFAGLLGSAFESGRTINVGDTRRRIGYFQAVPETKSELVVPIKNGDLVYGVINSESEAANHYTSTIIQNFEELALALAAHLHRVGWTSKQERSALPWIKRPVRA